MHLIKVSVSFRSRFFWQEYLTWFKVQDSELNSDQILRLQSIDLAKISFLLQKLEHGKLSNQKFKNIFKNYILKGSSLELTVEADVSDEYTRSVIDYLKFTYPEHFSVSPLPKNKINYLVGLGVKYSKGKVNPKKLQELLGTS